MKTRLRLRMVAWTILGWLFFTVIFTASFYLTSILIPKFHLNLTPFLTQLINSLLGILFVFMIIGSLSTLARKMGWVRQAGVLGPIIEAMEKIAKGDFSVRLADSSQADEPFGALIKSVNNMALELSQMEQMRQEFISNVSHEIQSPLTSIRGFAEALQKEDLRAEERAHYLSIIMNESTRLSRITDNLLRLASLESDQPKFEPRSYRLDKQIRDLILATEPQWSAKSIEMDVSLAETTFLGDEDLLSQVWMNLLHNSIKFTPPDGKICAALDNQKTQVIFTIRDSGMGISAEDQARIFERFYKADPSRTQSNGGSGLGLSIARKIVEMHQGTIEVESQVGAGAEFRVILPVSV